MPRKPKNSQPDSQTDPITTAIDQPDTGANNQDTDFAMMEGTARTAADRQMDATTDNEPGDAAPCDATTEDAATGDVTPCDATTGDAATGDAATDDEPGDDEPDDDETDEDTDAGEFAGASGNDFTRMGLSKEVMDAVVSMGFEQPTSIQTQTIPLMMDWRDVIAQAPTGTGKTVAFGIPIIEHFDPELADVQALILAPTRELALQITEELRTLAQNKPEIRIATIYGGQRIDKQLDELKHRPQIIVATPGRLIDHLNRRTVSLSSVRTVILDEADRMLDMGFVRDVRKILDKMPRAWQVDMFSATMSRAVMDISWIYQRDVVELKVVAEAEDKPQITQYSVEVGSHRRIDAIADIMKKHNYQKAIVFCNRKHVTDYVARRLSSAGIRAESIHGDIQQSTREKTLSSFRTGSLRVLVATDVAARGIDVEGVDAVFNYDIPDENEYYVHRIGRTGRAKHEGVAYTFTTLLTQPKLDEIMRYTKCEITPLKFD